MPSEKLRETARRPNQRQAREAYPDAGGRSGPTRKHRLPEERIRTDGTVDYLSQRATVKASQHPLRRGVPSCLPKAQGEAELHFPGCLGARRPRACARRRVLLALTTPPLFHRRHFFRDFHPAADGAFFLKGEATAQKKKIPPLLPRKTSRRWGQKGHRKESGAGVEAEGRRGSLRGLREKDRKPLWR